MFKTSPFTLKWRTNVFIPGGGSFTNQSYLDGSFNTISPNAPSWPPNNIWNNIWYNANPDYNANFFYDVFSYSTSGYDYGSYEALTYADAYIYYAPEYGCCWCECGGGNGTITDGVWADGYFNFATWGNAGECRSCRNNHWSTRWWYNYATRRYFNVYSRYNYIDHAQSLGAFTIYKDYSTGTVYYGRRRVD